MDNRLPNNDGSNENEHVHIIEERGDLCNDCRWVRKCHKYATVIQTLSELEQYMFEEFTVDVDTIALIKYCPTYSLSPDGGQYEQEDEEQ